jgi:hypothetical protein
LGEAMSNKSPIHYRAAVCAVGVGSMLWLGAGAPPRMQDTPSTQQTTPVACDPAVDTTRGRYVVLGRIRALLFWTGKREVGAARIAWSDPPYPRSRLELLIGTDPDTAPRKINRWGYVAENSCGPSAELLGLMTESDEETIEEAAVRLESERGGGKPYKAIRSSFAGGEANAEVFHFLQPAEVSYKSVRAVLSQLPTGRSPERMQVPPGTDTGFLVAVARLMDDRVAAYPTQGRRTDPVPPRTFLYGTQQYDLRIRSSRWLPELRIGTTQYERVIDDEFEVRNRATGHKTTFRIAYGTGGTMKRVPLRIVYRPRWWLELELLLTGELTSGNQSVTLETP